MLKRKSTPRAMPLLQTCRQLLKSKDFHKKEAAYYSQLFNDSVPPLDFDNYKVIEYTTLQQYWQLQAEYHKAEHCRIDAEIIKLEQAA
jgi:hypothetical protein